MSQLCSQGAAGHHTRPNPEPNPVLTPGGAQERGLNPEVSSAVEMMMDRSQIPTAQAAIARRLAPPGAVLLTTVLAALIAAGQSSAIEPSKPFQPAHTAPDASAEETPRAAGSSTKQLLLRQPGGYAGQVLSVFKMKLQDLLPYDEGRARNRLQPYLLGGTAGVKIRRDSRFGRDIPGEARGIALHVGGGTELYINPSLSLSFDFGEVVGAGAGFDHEVYQLGFDYRF